MKKCCNPTKAVKNDNAAVFSMLLQQNANVKEKLEDSATILWSF